MSVSQSNLQRRPLPTPLTLKAIYLLRHIADRADLFSDAAKSQHDRLLKRYQDRGPGRVLPVEEFNAETVDWDALSKRPLRSCTPFIVRGFSERRTIDWETLKADYGDVTVLGRSDGSMTEQSTSRIRLEEMPLRDVMKEQHGGKNAYATAASDIYTKHPEIKARLGLDNIEERIGKIVTRREMFVGLGGTGSPYHRAPVENYFVLIEGTKIWRLVAPQDRVGLYPLFGLNREATVHNAEVLTREYDPDRHPLYGLIDRYEATLNSGDLLHVPAFWWHEVENIGPSIACPHRVRGALAPSFALLLFLLRKDTVKTVLSSLWAKLSRKPSEGPDLSDRALMMNGGREEPWTKDEVRRHVS